MTRSRWATTALALIGLVVLSVPVTRQMHSSGVVQDTDVLPLGSASPVRGARHTRAFISNAYGYVILPYATGRLDVPLRFAPIAHQRTLIRLWADSAPVGYARVTLVDRHGRRHPLGDVTRWSARPFDVSRYLSPDSKRPRATLEISARNDTSKPVLVLDQIAQTQASRAVVITAQAWVVALWAALVALTALLAAGRLRRHWPLVAILGAAGYLLWRTVPGMSLDPLEGEALPLWRAAQTADWLSFHHGLWWGSWIGLSSLSVQLFHAMTPLVGSGDAGARGAGALLGVAAIAAIYAAGNRVAGRRGATVAAICALLVDPFRLQASLGAPVAVLALTGALFVYTLHVCLARAGRQEMVLLGAAGTLMCLADPIWVPGVAAAVIVIALSCAAPGQRLRLLGIGLLALGVLMLPNRASIADQGKGDPFADVNATVRYARNVEFAGHGHGAPSPATVKADPLHSGRAVGFGTYLFADHSLAVAVGGALSGTHKMLSVLAQRDESKLLGLAAFALMVGGLLYLLLLPRLRMLVIVPWLATAPGLFLVSRKVADPLSAGMGLWPALLVGGGVLAYALSKLAQERVRVPGRLRQLTGVLSRALALKDRIAPGARAAAADVSADGGASSEQSATRQAQDAPVA